MISEVRLAIAFAEARRLRRASLCERLLGCRHFGRFVTTFPLLESPELVVRTSRLGFYLLYITLDFPIGGAHVAIGCDNGGRGGCVEYGLRKAKSAGEESFGLNDDGFTKVQLCPR